MVKSGTFAQSPSYTGAIPFQKRESSRGHPILGFNASNSVEAISCFPQVFQYVDEIQDKRHIRSILTNKAKNQIGLLFAPVDKHCPRAFSFRSIGKGGKVMHVGPAGLGSLVGEHITLVIPDEGKAEELLLGRESHLGGISAG